MKRLLLLSALLSGCVAIDPATGGPRSPFASPAMAPAPAVSQAPVKFESDGTKKGAQGPFRLEAGKRTFKATHGGEGSFYVNLKPSDPNRYSRTAFSEKGKGAWEWAYVVEAAGDYYLEVALSDGAWTLSIE